MHNSSNFIVPVSPNDKEIMIQDVNSRKTFTINPWEITFTSVSTSAILVRTVGSEHLVTIIFISSSDALLALPKLQRAITQVKDQTHTGLDQDTINYINSLFSTYAPAYHHIQTTPSNKWTFSHNLNKRTAVTITDSNNQEIIGSVNYLSDDSLEINFNQLVSGNAWI